MTRNLAIACLAVTLLGLPGCMDRAVNVDLDHTVSNVDIKRGTGVPAGENNIVELHYTATLPDGKIVIDTRANGKSHSFRIGDGSVIPGMDIAVRGMRVGGIREVTMPPVAHYGRHGYADVVPPETNLYFRIELLSMRF